MEKTLRKASLKKVLPRILVCFLLAVVLLALTGLGIFKLMAGPTPLSSVDLADAEGRYVSVDASQALAGFATYSVNDEVTKEYFILDIGNGQYMAISARGDSIDLLESAGDQSEDYYVNATLDSLNSIGTVSGVISALPEELETYLDDAIDSIASYLPDLDGVSDPTGQLLYLSLDIDRIGLFSTSAVVVLSVIALVFLLLAIIQLVLVCSGFYQRKAKAVLDQAISGEEDRKAVEEDFAAATIVEHVRVGKRFTWYQHGARTDVVDNNQILWAYCQIEPLVVSKYRWPMCIWTRDGEQTGPHLQSQKSVKTILQALEANGCRFLSGYDANRLRSCTSDFDAFLKAADSELSES